ncbi:MAG: right-handed parallel beta-helix repeat-containing protein [Methanomicrobiales archaeon]|nr:right-handed parallel beta-helix repeat-containing protein [Methanomicrobiales archaeon]
MSVDSRAQVREALGQLLGIHGTALCREPSRCEAFLRDMCPQGRRETAVLVAALKYGICDALLDLPEVFSREELIHSLSSRLFDEAGIDREWALWAVVTWALALGVLDKDIPPFSGGGSQKLPESGAKRRRPAKKVSRREIAIKSLIVDASGAGDFQRIGDALEMSGQGARIFVRPGTYRENLTISKEVEVIGEGRPSEVIVSPPGGTILVVSKSAYVHGLTFVYAPSEKLDVPAVEFRRGSALMEDCSIVSASEGIRISGAGTTPTIRRCRIETGEGEGICCDSRSKPVIEFTTITSRSPASAAVHVCGGAAPVMKDSSVKGGHACMEFRERSRGLMERCTISGAVYAGISIQELADPHLLQCAIENGQTGIEISNKGKGTLENCEVKGSREGIRITEGGDPSVKRCRVHRCLFGIRVSQKGRGTIEGCTITRNDYSGVSIKEEGSPFIRRCTITENGDAGIWVHKKGRGRVEENDLEGNRKGGLHIEAGSKVKARGNRGTP